MSDPSPVAGHGDGAPASVSALGANSSTATIVFGHRGVGSGYPAPVGHDQSSHAVDKLLPATVVIKAGGTVTFETFGVHQVAIYAPGKRPEDVNVNAVTGAPGGCPPVPLINDTSNRIAYITKPCSNATVQLTSPAGTFDTPGRYLVICTFLPHFVEFTMYGWVIVK